LATTPSDGGGEPNHYVQREEETLEKQEKRKEVEKSRKNKRAFEARAEQKKKAM
jgi:hypothetical protein